MTEFSELGLSPATLQAVADTGYTTFSWLALSPERWTAAKDVWQDFRNELSLRYRIPVQTRLHATDLAAGRCRPSHDRAFDVQENGWRIIREGLERIAAMDGLTVGTVYRLSPTPSRAKQGLYRALLGHLNGELCRAETMGIIFMDGDGSDRRYAGAHRDRPSYAWSTDTTVYIREGARGKGIGRSLYATLLRILAAQNYRRAFAGIALPNAGSVALHEAVGFSHIGTYPEVGFKLGRWHDVGWWSCALHRRQGAPALPIPLHEVGELTRLLS